MAVYEGKTEPTSLYIRLIWNTGCYGIRACGSDKTVVWQSYCGCWTFSCLSCGNYEHAACCDENSPHWDDFEEEAQWLS